MSETRRIGTWDRHDGWTRADHPSSQIPRLKCGWLRLWFRFTGGRHCLLDGEGHGLLSPIRRPSLPNRRVALRGPAPRAKPAGAPPHPRGFLPRTKSGVGGNPNPLAGEDRLPRKLPSMSLSEPLQYPIAGLGIHQPPDPNGVAFPRSIRHPRPSTLPPSGALKAGAPLRHDGGRVSRPLWHGPPTTPHPNADIAMIGIQRRTGMRDACKKIFGALDLLPGTERFGPSEPNPSLPFHRPARKGGPPQFWRRGGGGHGLDGGGFHQGGPRPATPRAPPARCSSLPLRGIPFARGNLPVPPLPLALRRLPHPPLATSRQYNFWCAASSGHPPPQRLRCSQASHSGRGFWG